MHFLHMFLTGVTKSELHDNFECDLVDFITALVEFSDLKNSILN